MLRRTGPAPLVFYVAGSRVGWILLKNVGKSFSTFNKFQQIHLENNKRIYSIDSRFSSSSLQINYDTDGWIMQKSTRCCWGTPVLRYSQSIPTNGRGVISKPHAVVAIRQWLECNSLEGEPQQLKSTGTASEKSHVTDTFDDIKYYLSGVGTV